MDSDQGKLFIGGISWETTEEKLQDYFSQYGDVLQAVVMRDKTTGRPRGFGFVVFADPSTLDRVLQEKHTIDGRMVEAKKALSREEQQTSARAGNVNPSRNTGNGGNIRTKKIFVGGLPPTMTEDGFRQYFEDYGPVTDVVIMYDQNTQRPRGFGFISFDSEDAVDRVLHKTFHDLNGKQVEVKRALPKDANPGGGSRSMSGGANGGAGGYQGYGASGGNANSYDGRMDSNRYMQPQSTGGGFPPYGSSGFNAPGYGYGPANNGVGYGGYGSYGGASAGYGGPAGAAYGNPNVPSAGYASGPPGAPRSSWSSQAPSGYGAMGYGHAPSWGTPNAGAGSTGPGPTPAGQSPGGTAGYGNQGYGYGSYVGNDGSYGNPAGYGAVGGRSGGALIGSMNLMASLGHHRIAAAAKACKAKRLMAFSLGDTRVIVTCNPDVAKEILNSTVFADRPVKESAYRLMFNRAIGFAPYGVYWRTLRRIAATHLFCPKQIKAAEAQRCIIACQMVDMLKDHDQNFTVRGLLKRASLNNMMCSVFGLEYRLDSLTNEVEELRGLVDEGYDLLGTLNWTDHLPWLADFDPQKIRFRCSSLVPKVNRFVSRIIAEHRVPRGGETRDFVDVLLSLQGPEKLSDADMIAVLWEMIFRGTDTVAVLIEWILARMVLHPDVQSRVHDELDKVVGRSRAVAESDITAMLYLNAAVKEVLRLHPPGPLLSWARLAITDTTIDGYHVPAGTTAMVNMWAIARDPELWADPLEFIPERFVAKEGEMEFSVLGSDLRLAPFGSGRRTCPGKNLGLTTVTFWVASLLHEFEWLPSDENGVDLSEVLGLSCEMANPLTVKVRARRH